MQRELTDKSHNQVWRLLVFVCGSPPPPSPILFLLPGKVFLFHGWPKNVWGSCMALPGSCNAPSLLQVCFMATACLSSSRISLQPS